MAYPDVTQGYNQPGGYDLNFEMQNAMGGTTNDVQNFLSSATAQLQQLATKQKNYIRAQQSVGGTGASSQMSQNIAAIDQGTQEMYNDIMRRVAIEEQRQAEAREAYEQEKRDYESALNEQKSKATTEGLADLAGLAVGAATGGLGAAAMGGTMGADISAALKGASIGSELGKDVAGLSFGDMPTGKSLNLLAQDANQPENLDKLLDKYFQKYGLKTQEPSLDADVTPPPAIGVRTKINPSGSY